ncbi:endoplasmic reticulum membrane adapter protein XK-like [Branchiostoma floridae x Branchiostoma japonicum]
MCTKCSGFWLVVSNLFKFAMYIADVVTDIMLAVEYLRNEDTNWGGLTLGFALGPQVIMNMTMWYQEGRDPRTFILYFLQIGVALKYLQIVFGVCCGCYDPSEIREQRSSDENIQEPESRRVHHILPLVHLIGSLLESVPQICIQVYVLIVTGELQRVEIETLKYVSILMSVVMAVKSVWDWEMHYLVDVGCLKNVLYRLLFFVWKVAELFARTVAISVFSSEHSYGVFIVVGVHWLVMAVTENVLCRYFKPGGKRWVHIREDIYSESSKCVKICFNLLTVASLDVLSWTTFPARKVSPIQPLVNGFLTLAGNCVMVLVWYFTKDTSAWYDMYALIVVLAGTAIALILKTLYLWCYACGPCRNTVDEEYFPPM